MMEPRTIDRVLSPRGGSLALQGSVVMLGLVALTGCAWAVLGGHAWLRLLSGCSRWLVSSAVQPAPAEAPVAPSEPPKAPSAANAPSKRAAQSGPLLAPITTARATSPAPAAPSKSKGAKAAPAIPAPPAPIDWPEELEYGGATCSGVFVYAVTLNERAPRLSAVSLATSSSGRGKFTRPGQSVEGWEVLDITDDWTGANPVVWLARDEQVCRATLTGNPARVKAVQLEARQREAQLRQEAERRRQERRRRRRARRKR